MKLQRKSLRIQSLHEETNDGFVNASVQKRLALVWELTKDACALSPKHDAEQRLQRHIVQVARLGN